jgi:protease-4
MFAFLPSLPDLSNLGNDVRALAGRVDTARHHGIPNGCVLEVNLRSAPPETTGFDPLTIISGGGRQMTLRGAVAAIHRAAEDPRVAGLIAQVQLAASPSAVVQELREAIAAFTAVKPSLAWAETYPGTLSYYLASAFGEVWMQPSGSVGLVGFASNATFLRDALEKAGIDAQFIARGEYKSYANIFTEDGFTDSHREAVTRMLDSLQTQVWEGVAESRHLESAALDGLADRAPLLRDDAVASGLIDRIGFRDEAYARIAELVGEKDISPEDEGPPRLYLARYAGASRPR